MKRRRLKRLFLVIALVGVVTLPWWQRAAVHLGTRVAGADYVRYESVAGGRFRLHGVRWANTSTTFAADEVEGADLVRWAWTRQARLEVRRWTVAVSATDGKTASDQPAMSPAKAVRMASGVTGQLTRWLGRIDAREGRVVVAFSGEQVFVVPRIDYSGGVLTAAVSWRDEAVELRAEAGADAVEFDVVSEKRMLRLQGRLTDARRVSATLRDVSGRTEGSGTLEAELSDSWRLNSLTTRGADWRVPAAVWDVTGRYGELAGGWSAEWKAGAGSVRIDAGAEPREGEGVPPVQIAIEAEGDRTQVAIRRLEVVLPQAEARLAEPFVMDWGGRFISGRSVFDFDVDLAALRAAGVDGLAGRVAGRAAFAPGPLSALVVDFSLSGRGLAWESQVIGDVAAEGEVRWPGIVLRKAGVTLDGGMVELSGRYDAATKSIADGVLSAALADESVVTRWIRAGVWPEGAGFGATKAAVRFSGTLPEALAPGALAGLRHEGELEAQAVRVPSAAFLKPLAVSVAWSGQGGGVDVSRLYFETNDKAAAWELAGKLRPAVAPGDADALTIGSWRWLRGGATWTELAVPVMVRRGGDVLVAVSPLRLVGGGEGSFSVSAEGVLQPGGGRVRLEAGNVTEDMLEDWLLSGAGDMAAWAKGASLASFLVEADWQGDGAVTGLARGEVRLEPLPGAPLAALFDIVANESVVELRKAEIRARGAVLADVQGRLPVTLHARREGWLQWREAEPFSVDLVSRDDVGWKEELAALSGIKLSGAELRASVSGTLREPGGTIRLRAGGLEIPENARERLPFSLPSVTDVRVEVALGKEGIRVEEASVKIDGQPVSMSGRLPVKSSEWMQLPQSWAELVRERAEGRLRITEARVASIARYMPTYLAPAGVLSADVAYGPHQRIEGLVTLHGASSRPLGPLGVLQQVEARIRFQGRSVVLESIKALAGGQPVMLTGGAEWPRGGRPVFDVRLRGENTPFVRQTGLVVRGDIDLTVRSLPGEPGRAKIGGEVRLRDSVFLSDLTSLMPTGVKGVARRPPYFAVEEAPFNAWELDVALRGERFMRVRSPVFEGVVSARFNLTGTLGNPRAVGEARVARGRVIFPFAVFVVQEGASVRLTEAAPYEPRLLVSGVAQRYDYDLRLELTGTAEAPVLQFFSSPALDSEQILMLVMAGVAPSESSLSTSTHRLARFGTYVGADMLRQLGVNDDAAERLTVRTGEKLSRQGKETYAMEYALGGRWSLVGEYDEFDGYNAGLKWRFTPRRKDEAGGGPVKQETETKGAETKEEVQP